MPTLYTVGWQGKALKVFITQLTEAGVDAVIDIRLRNTSHLAGYTKREDLRFMLGEGFGIAYEHRPELAPTDAILDAYRGGKNKDWAAYESAFKPLLAERQAEAIGREILARYRAPCLLCAEATAENCHRRLVAEHWAAHISGLVIIHL
jgi:uncharacterized protein (DUF488 family)